MLYLVRHGRTPANAKGQLQGRLDPPLDKLGQQQAVAIAGHVHKLTAPSGGIQRLISSPLQRAQQTAQYFDTSIDTDDRWAEMDYGSLEGADVSSVSVDVWMNWYADADFSVEDGESFNAVTERVTAAIEAVSEQASAANVVVVSHVGPIKATVGWALGVGHQIAFRCHLAQGSLCRIGFGRFGPRLITFNETVD